MEFLRLAQWDDLDTVMAMYKDALSYEGCVWDEYYPNREILLDDFQNGGLYVYVLKNKVIGAISVINDEELDKFKCWKIQDERRISFARVVIAKNCLGQGYGRNMVAELLEILRSKGYVSVQILVSPKNKSAMRVYQRLDFEFYDIAEAHGEEFYLALP